MFYLSFDDGSTPKCAILNIRVSHENEVVIESADSWSASIQNKPLEFEVESAFDEWLLSSIFISFSLISRSSVKETDGRAIRDFERTFLGKERLNLVVNYGRDWVSSPATKKRDGLRFLLWKLVCAPELLSPGICEGKLGWKQDRL